MSTPITISDAALEAMLARRAHRADPDGLRDAAFLRIEATAPPAGIGLGAHVAAALGWRQAVAVPAFAWVLLLAGLLLAMVLGSLAAGAWRPDRAVVITPTAPPDVMTTGRAYHTATLLEDGRVLLTGGDLRDMIEVPASAELYDPATGAFVATGSMATKHRMDHTAIRLADGRVLLVGGIMVGWDPLWREIWDPATGRFTTPGARDPGASADGPHVMAAGPLADGRVLVHRTTTSATRFETGRPWNTLSAELLDPATGALTETGALVSDPKYATATLLRDGRVLVVGGAPKALVYDPATGEFTATGIVSDPVGPLAAVTLLDGRVLILGDETSDIYDPATGSIVPTNSMTHSRTRFAPVQEFAAVLLADGRVLVTGGDRLGTAELYDPATGTFSLTGSMAVPRYGHTATLLGDGTVLIAGGASRPGLLEAGLASAELFDPGAGAFRPVGQR
jgi:hypothetical protein